MELYVGGRAQGKLDFVLHQKKMEESSKLICDGVDCTTEDILTKPIINHFHEFIRRLIIENEEVEAFLEKLIKDNPSVIILCDEVGYGIVPMEKEDRRYREIVGRSCCKLAEYADSVVRIVCGIGQKLK